MVDLVALESRFETAVKKLQTQLDNPAGSSDEAADRISTLEAE